MTIFEAIILGIIQGLTEFLPVSSSGHIELGTFLLGVSAADNLLFTVVVHAATALSTVFVFRKDIAAIIKDLFKFEWNEGTKFTSKILLSMVPIGIVGVFFEKEVEAFFGGKIIFVGAMLWVTACLLTFSHYVHKKEGEVSFSKALIIGLAQTIAILPGISRSGSTIATALLIGVEKDKATRFSFLMVLLPILGASALKMKKFIEAPAIAESISGAVLAFGFLAAFLAGLAACIWMINIVRKGKLIYFAVYCAIVGSIAILGGLYI
ncbi:undecaprenyl-diphosphate phosphatase [Echinicola jeungdonensis]|uniref:Undecaprenyl-diphosphatase n=1 Tax=Echinicola jeungdonensis TaxID=709343 RepID=A0ABV5J5W9_9BACT|nr:undecaprenyl-diphosphate phosphatase [Echinicola jeungdonensis]MDN3670938.1 undecaprenyl-diphosphate phosphatase [Echinicola jeungdonensis]